MMSNSQDDLRGSYEGGPQGRKRNKGEMLQQAHHHRSSEGFGSYRDNDLKDMEMLNMAYQPGDYCSRQG